MFHNGSTCDYHFIIDKLAKEFEGQFECLGENTKEYLTFSVLIKKDLDNGKTITYKISLLIALDLCQAHYQAFLIKWMSSKIDQLIFRCFDCKNNDQKDFNKDLINRFANTYGFCNKDINKFVLLFRKRVYRYEYIDCWTRFDETSLPYKEASYRTLNMKGITSVNYRREKRV